MMSKEQREELRNWINAVNTMTPEVLDKEKFIANARIRVPAMLDSLDEAEALAKRNHDSFVSLEEAFIKQGVEMRADRNHWKVRCEALERAIDGECYFCVNVNKRPCMGCRSKSGGTASLTDFKFDKERFEQTETTPAHTCDTCSRNGTFDEACDVCDVGNPTFLHPIGDLWEPFKDKRDRA